MTRIIRDDEIGWVIAGLRLLQGALIDNTLDDELCEIAAGDDGALPDREAINALCERLVLGGVAVRMPQHEWLHEWLQVAKNLLRDDQTAAAQSVIEQIIKNIEGKA